MTTQYVLVCDTEPTAFDAAGCADGWTIHVVETFDVSAITPADAAAFIGAGFFLTLPLYAAVKGVKSLIDFVR